MKDVASRLALCAAAGPAAAAVLAVVLFAVIELSGWTPLSIGRPLNIAEAAGLGSGAEVMRMLRAGDDPTRIMPVRPEVISASVRQVSALEAAVWSRRVSLMQLLDTSGAIIGDTRDDLACLAQDLRAVEIVEYLAPNQALGCVEGEASRRIITRQTTGQPE